MIDIDDVNKSIRCGDRYKQEKLKDELIPQIDNFFMPLEPGKYKLWTRWIFGFVFYINVESTGTWYKRIWTEGPDGLHLINHDIKHIQWIWDNREKILQQIKKRYGGNC